MRSIHGKIVLAFTALALLMAALGLFSFLDMLFLENRVHQGVVVANLEYTVMAMRRQEKNLFLYGDPVAGQGAAELARQAAEQLGKEQRVFARLGESHRVQEMTEALEAYRQLLTGHLEDGANSETRIRDRGHAITRLAEGLVLHERQALARSIAASQWALALSIMVLALLVVGVGRILAKQVVSPLRRLPEALRPIAEGRFNHLVNQSPEVEMVAFTEAFNTMLDELESRRRRLLQSEKLAALGVLVAGVAHELNNPLSNISSSCQLLHEESGSAEPAQLAEWAAVIDSETERARAIVSALMNYGRRGEVERAPVRLRALMESTGLLLKGPLRELGARLEIDIPETVTLRADPQRLQQLFINLLRNAAESGGGVTVRVTASPCGEALPALPSGAEVVGEPDCGLRWKGCATQIVIEDDGRGIPPEDLAHVFEPFYSRRETGQGMGLGLYIVQEIVQEHDGCIAISSWPRQGTQIFLRLPCEGVEA